ncbi:MULTISPECIES: nucleoside deaminase [Actinomadura]|uniref:Nucleoside deaminase n=1 Tax=Actinomadura yumaensis TaxID=111807 RepID=A0ABW2CVM2_9ACTN|nr:nucleoside deaminase [Actinomadura sp. J1-007]MWK37728.1 nucleoside deaminase [Actinomadura sp. J1-007]
MDDNDLRHLRRCVELAEAALEAGEEPFGSVLVGADGAVLAEDHNRITSTGDPTAHPELALAQWAALNLSPGDRAGATVYTSGEHCPMCSAAHGWAGVGRVVYAVSAARLAEFSAEIGLPESPVRPIPVQDVAPGVTVEGPEPSLEAEMLALHRRRL